MADQGYARPEMLVTTEWLAAHLNDANLCLVDCDNRDAYRRAALRFSADRDEPLGAGRTSFAPPLPRD